MVLPDAVRDEGNEQIIWAGTVEVLPDDNEGRAFFPATNSVYMREIDVDDHPPDRRTYRHVGPFEVSVLVFVG
ncbi:MAG TPA: hypothetical protein VKK81_09415 [Candidatus Binatia bacterium]|nr:hypothetical protein [Candidatus Binatia bacterium]